MKYRSLLISLLSASALSIQAAPTIEFDTTVFDCGTIIKGKQTKLEAVFKVKNTGDEPLKLEKVKPACGCTVVKFDSLIAPGKSTTIKSTVNIKGRKGSLNKRVTVTSNAANDSIVRLLIKARIIDPLTSSLNYIDMTGKNETQKFALTLSTPKKDLKVTDVVFKPKGGKSIKVSYTLTPADSAGTKELSAFTLEMEPVQPEKLVDGEFLISTNHPDRKEMRLLGKAGKQEKKDTKKQKNYKPQK